MSEALRAAETFLEAAALNREDALLTGSLLDFPAYGQLIMTGDIHGHRRNFERLQRYCDLKHYGARHVILHELIHEEVETLTGKDHSHKVLLDAAKWKIAFPDQVHFLQSNHELAQLNRHEITKNGRVVTAAFEQSVAEFYHDRSGRVLETIGKFIRSFPLGGRTPNGVFVSHSLPSPQDLPTFDPSVFSRAPTLQDLDDGGSAHLLVWGRYHTPAALDMLGEMLNADYFICGHQPQESGYDVQHDRLIILASNHNHGTYLPIELGKPVDIEILTKNIRPFAGLT